MTDKKSPAARQWTWLVLAVIVAAVVFARIAGAGPTVTVYKSPT
jgi:hypothetical protein